MDASATQLDEEENVQPLRRDGLDGAEVDREHALRLSSQERSPGQARTLTGTTDARLAQDLPDRRCRHFQVEPVDLADDALVTPARVLARCLRSGIARRTRA